MVLAESSNMSTHSIGRIKGHSASSLPLSSFPSLIEITPVLTETRTWLNSLGPIPYQLDHEGCEWRLPYLIAVRIISTTSFLPLSISHPSGYGSHPGSS